MASKWEVKAHEKGRACGANSSGDVKAHVPAIMPLISYGKPKKKTKPIKKKCFVNAKKCKPRMGTKVKTRNYLEIKRSHTAKKTKLKHGTKIDIDVRNKDVDNMVVAGKKIN